MLAIAVITDAEICKKNHKVDELLIYESVIYVKY